MTEAISSQATLVFGLLRYARNDKKPRWPHCVRDDNPELVIANSERVKQSHCQQMAAK
ncbi:MAG: hypothetical protein UHC59_09145 [Fibrobacteraceae bacterium]|nr:hypothetical protein [Fibrobacteraceae bacterium]